MFSHAGYILSIINLPNICLIVFCFTSEMTSAYHGLSVLKEMS